MVMSPEPSPFQDDIDVVAEDSNEMTSQPLEESPTDFSTEKNSIWLENEILLLIEGKKRLNDEMREGTLMKTLRTGPQRWEYISNFLYDMGVRRSALQCEYKWSRIWGPFKVIFYYEKCIPSGRDSFWQMSVLDRVSFKLPRTFDPKIFAAMRSNFGGDRAIDPGHILIDMSTESLPGKVPTMAADLSKHGGFENANLHINEDVDADVVELSQMRQPDFSSGKKRLRSGRATIVKKEFEESTKELLQFLNTAESTRKESEKDLVEITKHQFEAALKLQHEIAQQSNSALIEIAGAIRLFSSNRAHHI